MKNLHLQKCVLTQGFILLSSALEGLSAVVHFVCFFYVIYFLLIFLQLNKPHPSFVPTFKDLWAVLTS